MKPAGYQTIVTGQKNQKHHLKRGQLSWLRRRRRRGEGVVVDEGVAESRGWRDVGRARYSIPFPRNQYFVGRDTVLQDLRQKLFIRPECQKLAIVGLGGVFAQAKDLQDDVAFTQSDTGFSNSDIMLDWLRHFNRYSFGYNADFKRLGVTSRNGLALSISSALTGERIRMPAPRRLA